MSKSLRAVFQPEKFDVFPGVSNQEVFEGKWKKDRRLVLSNMSHAAYLAEEGVRSVMGRLGAEKVSFFEKEGAQAFLAEWPDKAILAFRGSEPQEDEPSGLLDRLVARVTDRLGINFDPTLVGFLGNDVLADIQFTKGSFDALDNVRVHKGFRKELNKLWQNVKSRLDELSTTACWCTGHSLGAALATLAGMRFEFEEVVTFGEPRVGLGLESAFKGKRHIRVVNGDDPVAKVPPPSFGYKHHGELVRIADPGGAKDFRFDHSIVYYSENLEEVARQAGQPNAT